MVIDHHQLNVFGLILYTSWHVRSLRRNNTFYHQNRQTDTLFSVSWPEPFQHRGQFQRSTHSKRKDQLMSPVSPRKEKKWQINEGELCKAKPGLSAFQTQNKDESSSEGWGTDSQTYDCVWEKTEAASTLKVNISWKRRRRERRVGERGNSFVN